MRLKKQALERVLTVLLLLALAISFIPFIFRIGFVESYDTTNVTATVNITNAAPVIIAVDVHANQTMALAEGTTYRITCNVTVQDYSDFDDIKYVNATFFLNRNQTLTDPNDPNDMYRNTSCTINSSIDSYTGTYLCSLDIEYFAFNGTWNCTVYVRDSFSFEENGSGNGTMGQLYAMNLSGFNNSDDQIDYGNLTVYMKSDNESVNVTNFGNQRINLSVFGYGGDDEARGQGWALVCSVGDNITIDNERFSINNGSNWAQMTPLSNSPQTLEDFSIPKQTQTGVFRRDMTKWTLYVPPNPFGVCNGTVVFEALASDLGEY